MAGFSMSVTSTNRVIALVDMDCFYVQVEERDDPSIKGVPAAVVQYKAYKGGGIIAVNYEARAKGVTRSMRGDDAKAVCPEIQLVRVPETRGKADLTKYRDASAEVMNVLTDFSSCVERASIDEAYLDLTEAVENRMSEIASSSSFISWEESLLEFLDLELFTTNFVHGYESTNAWFDVLRESEVPSLDNIKLTLGAELVGKIRAAVYAKTNFRCSAGIAHNKVVAKLVCGMNKPNKQTVLPHSSVPNLWATTRIGKVRGLGGKLGDYLVEKMGCVNMSDLNRLTETQLCAGLGTKIGQWIYQLSLGYDDEPVTPRQLPKSIGCNKNFLGPEALRTKEKVKFWIGQLASEVVERIQRDLEMNNRRAKTLTLHVRFEDQNALSRSLGVNPNYNAERMGADAYAIMDKLYQSVGVLPVVCLGLIASKFEDEVDVSGYAKINDFFSSKQTTSNPSSSNVPGDSFSVPKAESDTKAISNSGAVIPKHAAQAMQRQKKSKGQTGSLSKFLVTKEKTTDIPSTSSAPPIISIDLDADAPSETVNPTPCSSASSVSPSSSENSSEISYITSVLPNTPTKSSSSSSGVTVTGQKRSAFFSCSSVTPKVQSPLKSPKKQVPTSSKEAAAAGGPLPSTSSTSNDSSHSAKTETKAPQPQPPQDVERKECERCGKKVLAHEYLSHLDFHFAKDLSKELNGLPSFPEAGVSNTIANSNSGPGTRVKETQKRPRSGRGGTSSTASKRGRPAKSTSTTSGSSSAVTFRKIDSFFTTQS